MKISDSREDYIGYCRDESHFPGSFARIAFPESTEELAAAMAEAGAAGLSVTLQGARTGVTGSGVPEGGLLIATEKLNAIGDPETDTAGRFTITAGAGVSLAELERRLDREGLCFRPTPGEKSASLGGLFVNRSCGINQYKYPAFGSRVLGAELVTAAGEIWELRRGDCVFGPKGCPLPNGGFLPVSGYTETTPPPGFLPREGADLLDVLACSEGMLAAVSRLTLRAAVKKGEPWALLFFFCDLHTALRFAERLLDADRKQPADRRLSFIELLDSRSLRLLAASRPHIQRLQGTPDFPDRQGAAIYIELEEMDFDSAEERLTQLLTCFEELGGGEEDAWAATGDREAERIGALRHLLPECINGRSAGAAEGRSLWLDLTVPAAALLPFAGKLDSDLTASGLEGYLFSHAAEGRLHVGFVLKSREEAARAEAMSAGWIAAAQAAGGSALNENGVGRTRRGLFTRSCSARDLRLLREIKEALDPEGRLNPGNMWEAQG